MFQDFFLFLMHELFILILSALGTTEDILTDKTKNELFFFSLPHFFLLNKKFLGEKTIIKSRTPLILA
jgi:uncharacterized protein YhhL (DUF1145 family)